MPRQRPSAPKPWRQYETRTSFLRVPADDWTVVVRGHKTEFRAAGHAVTQLWNVTCPTPAVGWMHRRIGGYESRLLVLEATWQEPLGAISPESLEREGFEDIKSFRRYWMQRHNKRFAPMQRVQVYRVRPFVGADEVTMGLQLLRKLYGEHVAAVRG